MAFEPQNELEVALERATNDVLARPDFYRLLMSSSLIVLGRELPGGANGAGRLSIPSVRHNGRDYLPIFSSRLRLDTFAPKGMEHFTSDARPLFEATRGANFVLNPKSEFGKTLSPAEIAYWLDPSVRTRRNLERSAMRFDVLRDPPAKLIDALTVLFKNRASVIAGQLVQAEPLDGHEPAHPVIAIEHEGDWLQMQREVSELAAVVLPDTIIDVIRIDRSIEVPNASEMPPEIPPFYRRDTKPN